VWTPLAKECVGSVPGRGRKVVKDIVFPEANNQPPISLEGSCHFTIPGDIPGNLFFPEMSAGGRHLEVPWASMPKAPIHKDHGPQSGESDVWPPNEVGLKYISKAGTPKSLAQKNLRLCVSCLDS